MEMGSPAIPVLFALPALLALFTFINLLKGWPTLME